MAPLSYIYRCAVLLLLAAACSCMTLKWGMSDPVTYRKNECFWSKSGWLKMLNHELDPNTNLVLSFRVNDLILCALDLKSCRPTIGPDVCSCTTETGNGELIKRFTVKTRPSGEDSGAALTARLEEISAKSASKSQLVTARELATLPDMREFVEPRPRCFFRGAKETTMEDSGLLRMTRPAGQLSTLQCCAEGAMTPVVTRATFNGETIHSAGKCLVAAVTGSDRSSRLWFKYKELGGCRREGAVEYGVVAPGPRRRSRRDTKVGAARIGFVSVEEENKMKEPHQVKGQGKKRVKRSLFPELDEELETLNEFMDDAKTNLERMEKKETVILFLICGLIAAGGIGAIIYMACTSECARGKSAYGQPGDGEMDGGEMADADMADLNELAASEKPSNRLSKFSMDQKASSRTFRSGSRSGSSKTDYSDNWFYWLWSKLPTLRVATVEEEDVVP